MLLRRNCMYMYVCMYVCMYIDTPTLYVQNINEHFQKLFGHMLGKA